MKLILIIMGYIFLFIQIWKKMNRVINFYVIFNFWEYKRKFSLFSLFVILKFICDEKDKEHGYTLNKFVLSHLFNFIRKLLTISSDEYIIFQKYNKKKLYVYSHHGTSLRYFIQLPMSIGIIKKDLCIFKHVKKKWTMKLIEWICCWRTMFKIWWRIWPVCRRWK